MPWDSSVMARGRASRPLSAAQTPRLLGTCAMACAGVGAGGWRATARGKETSPALSCALRPCAPNTPELPSPGQCQGAKAEGTGGRGSCFLLSRGPRSPRPPCLHQRLHQITVRARGALCSLGRAWASRTAPPPALTPPCLRPANHKSPCRRWARLLGTVGPDQGSQQPSRPAAPHCGPGPGPQGPAESVPFEAHHMGAGWVQGEELGLP